MSVDGPKSKSYPNPRLLRRRLSPPCMLPEYPLLHRLQTPSAVLRRRLPTPSAGACVPPLPQPADTLYRHARRLQTRSAALCWIVNIHGPQQHTKKKPLATSLLPIWRRQWRLPAGNCGLKHVIHGQSSINQACCSSQPFANLASSLALFEGRTFSPLHCSAPASLLPEVAL